MAEIPLQTSVLQSLRAVINLLALGKAHKEIYVYLAGANLTDLNKSSPGDICPSAIGETLRKLTAKCLCVAMRMKAADFFKPRQYGVVGPIGAEKVAHRIRSCIEKHWVDDDFGILNVDMRNAFNLAPHQVMLSECKMHYPELLPWVNMVSIRFWHYIESLTSESGVQQGDPLGPLLFSLLLNILVTTIAKDNDCSSL